MSITTPPPIPPSAWVLEKSVSLWQQLQQLLGDDTSLTTDEDVVAWLELPEGGAVPHPRILLKRLIDAAVWADRRAEEADNLAKRYAARKHRYEERGDAIRATIAQLADVLSTKAEEGELGAFSLVKGRDSVKITDESKLAENLFRIKKEPNKTAIGELLRDNQKVDGAELSNPGLVVRITPF